MTMFDEARAIEGMVRLCKGTQEELAARLGVSQSYIANKLRLLKFSPEMQAAITEADITERHARALLRLPDDKARRMALRRVQKETLSVAMTERLVDMLLTTAEQHDRAAVYERTITQLTALITDTIGALSSAGIRAKRTTEESASEVKIIVSFAKI